MNLQEYINQLSQLIEKQPELAECKVVHEAYDNNFQELKTLPVFGNHRGHEFTVISPQPFIEKLPINAACIIYY